MKKAKQDARVMAREHDLDENFVEEIFKKVIKYVKGKR